MSDLSSALSTWLWDYYLLATALLAAVLVAGAVVRQPARRRAIAWSTLCGLVGLALFCAWPSWARVHLLSPPPARPAWAGELEPLVFDAVQHANLLPATSTEGAVLPPNTGESASVPAVEVLVIDSGILSLYVFLAGSLLVVIWLVLGAWQVRRLFARASAPSEQVVRLFRALVDRRDHRTQLGLAKLPVPVAVGLWQPMILLPESLAETASADELRTVLTHELAHVRNRDLWLLAALRLLLVALWAHPLFWLLRRRVRLDQELLADAAAAEVSSRHDYAEQLVRLARSTATVRPPRLASSVGLWEGPSQLKRRVAILLDEKLAVWRRCSRRWLVASGMLVALATLVISLVTLKPASVAVAEAPSEQSPTVEQPDESPAPNEKPSVRIIAIGTNGEQPVKWWSEKGELIDQPVLALTPNDSISPTPNRQLIFAVEGLADDADVTWQTLPASNTASNRVTSGDPEDKSRYYGHVFDVKDDTKVFELRVGISSGPWITIGSGLSSSMGILNKSLIFSPAVIDARGDTSVIVSHNFDDAATRVVAIAKSGKKHSGVSSGGTSAGPLNQTNWHFPGLTLGDLETCEFQTRPYEWFEFEELPTQPRADGEGKAADQPWSVHGQVTDVEGRGIPRVELRAATGYGTLFGGGRTETDDNGQFHLYFGPGIAFKRSKYAPRGVGVQAASIFASKPGWFEANLCRQGDLLMTDLTPETIGDGAQDWGHKSLNTVVFPKKPKEVNFVMKPVAEIEGVLEESSGGWEVEDQGLYVVGPELPPSSSALTSFTTGRYGKFLVENLPTGFEWRFGMRVAKTAMDLETNSFRLDEPGKYQCRLVLEVDERDAQGVAMQLRVAKMVKVDDEQPNKPPIDHILTPPANHSTPRR